MTTFAAPVSQLKPVLPLLEMLLRIREDMVARSTGPYLYIGKPDVDYVSCFKGGYAECLQSLGVQTGPDVLFGAWLRDIKQEWPAEGWESAYLRENAGDHTRALRRYLDHVAEFRALTSRELAALPWLVPEDAGLATRARHLQPTREPTSTLDFLLRIRREVEASPSRLFLFIGPIAVKRMAGLIAGYRLCLALAGARDGEYTRFEHWLQDEKGQPNGQDWSESFLAACPADVEQAIRRLLDLAAEFRGG